MKRIRYLAGLLLTLLLVITAISPAFAIDYTPTDDLGIHAQNVLLLNTDTNTVVFEKNAEEKVNPSSLAKIMTAGLVLEYVTEDHLDDAITMKKALMEEYFADYSGYISTGLYAGETVRIRDLVAGLMIQSANDAAVILADYVETHYLNGASFVDVMNQKANELGCSSTHFTTAHGVREEDAFTTASDMMKITQYALSFPILEEICSYDYYQVESTAEHDSLTFINTNSMIFPSSVHYYSPAGAVRGAATSEGMMHLVTTATYEGQHYILVLLNCPSTDADGKEADYPYDDSETLYRWALTTYKVKKVTAKGDLVSGVEVPVHLSLSKKFTIVVPANDVYLLLPMDISVDSLLKSIHLEDDLKAPLSDGQEVGTMDLLLNGEVVATVGLEASEEIERSTLLYVLDLIARFFALPLVRILLTLFVLFAIGYVLYMIQINSKKEQQKRREELQRKRRNRE